MKPTKQQRKQKDILFILISSFIVVVAWIGFNIYHIKVTSTVSEHIQYQLNPINPTFDQQTMQELKNRENINPLFEQTQTATQAATTPPPSEEISPSQGKTPAASQEALTGK
jgi:hypothetical protein